MNGPPFQVARYIFCPLVPPAEREMLSARVVGKLSAARVERAQLYRARSASTGIVPATLPLFSILSLNACLAL
jgi:hypothetical protein